MRKTNRANNLSQSDTGGFSSQELSTKGRQTTGIPYSSEDLRNTYSSDELVSYNNEDVNSILPNNQNSERLRTTQGEESFNITGGDGYYTNDNYDARAYDGKRKCMHKGRAITTAILCSIVLALSTCGLYYNFVSYPPIATRDEDNAGLGAIRRWNEYLKNVDLSGISKEIGEDKGYLELEIDYANSNEEVITFKNNVIKTVKYSPRKIEAKNIYGNTMIDRTNNQPVYEEDLLNDKDSIVDLTYIDYTKITFNAVEIANFLKTNNISPGEPDYNNQIIELFCKYMNELKWADIPTTMVERAPQFSVKDGKHTMSAEEDIFLDKLLFSSDEFNDLIHRFDLACNGGEEIPTTEEWIKWSKLKDEDKATVEEPVKESSKHTMARLWCGSYYLQNEYLNNKGEHVVIGPQKGDGTYENPATIGTSVLTYVLAKEKNKTIAYPIRLELSKLLTENDCHEYLAEKDTRNRGLDESSRTRYASMEFTVTNISDKTLTISDNSSLADKQGNMSARTGTMYGLKQAVTLKPGESGTIETWVSSTELDRKYFIWGANFKKRAPIKYFSVFKYDNMTDDTSND